jgi:hypothetical protein
MLISIVLVPILFRGELYLQPKGFQVVEQQATGTMRAVVQAEIVEDLDQSLLAEAGAV